MSAADPPNAASHEEFRCARASLTSLAELCGLTVATLATAALADSIAVVGNFERLLFLVSGAILGALAYLLAWLIRPEIRVIEQEHANLFSGLRVAVVGVCIAFAGWFTAVYWSPRAAMFVVPAGIAVGFLGAAIHIYLLFFRRK